MAGVAKPLAGVAKPLPLRTGVRCLTVGPPAFGLPICLRLRSLRDNVRRQRRNFVAARRRTRGEKK
jgi:hypothetical protein